jgi:hypothetical protein
MAESRIKKHYILENKQMCSYGALKALPILKTIKVSYNDDFNADNDLENPVYAEVYVKNMHSIDIAKELVAGGYKPVIVTTVEPSFDGQNLDNSENMHDDIINLRTNYYKTVMTNIYPIVGPSAVYVPCLTVIRDLSPKELYKVSLIVSAPIKDPKLVEGDKNGDMMNFDDYYLTKQMIDTIFQTAINANHDTIILTDFGCKTSNNPLSEIVKIYNMAILKYAHMFKYIIFAFHLRNSLDVPYYTYYNKEIIKLQDLVNEDDVANLDINLDLSQENVLNK